MDDLAAGHCRNMIGTRAIKVTRFEVRTCDVPLGDLCGAAPNQGCAAAILTTVSLSIATTKTKGGERKMDLGQLAMLAICGIGTLGALTAMAFFAQKNSTRRP
ncbi:hypothetical protein [Hephaestia mangrovi]|uniref:hypothetical protein n=1 Tax=Hephaestia mangrovi TaxID=2873268 RepID=UPI001CA62DC1|nr:hypothetical protein [Hephaestia mangrovi]MBY8827829.1 hypothetical protein [Hephaestia mangrovi]